MSFPSISRLDYGSFLVHPGAHRDHVQAAVVRGVRWEPDIVALCEKYAVPTSTVVDIGANIGTHTVRLAQLVGPSGKVVAFEPQRVVFQQLCGNVFLNDLRNVYAHNMAIGGNELKKVHLTPINYDSGAPGEVRVHGTQGEEVWCYPLDFFLLTNVSLIKMDVERFEPFVFDGARKTIDNNRPVILFELTTLPLPDYPPDYCLNFLAERNYSVYSVGEQGDYIAIPSEKE